MSWSTTGGKISFWGAALTLLCCVCGVATGADEGRHWRYVAPLSNPLFNETPYITTELRPIYFHQTIPDDFLTQGGDIDVVAIQARLALTDRLGIIASKDGYADIDFDSVLPDEDGFANISVASAVSCHYRLHR